MKVIIKKFIFLAFIFVFIPQPVFAEPLSKPVNSSTLIEDAKQYNGKNVVFEGEVIGDVMNRGTNTWINANDDPYSLNKRGHFGYNSGQSIWVDSDLTNNIKYAGNYFWRGDRIKIEGTFNRVCRIHGGDMDIHATELEVVNIGHPIKHSIKAVKILAIIILSIATGVIYALTIVQRRRRLTLV